MSGARRRVDDELDIAIRLVRREVEHARLDACRPCRRSRREHNISVRVIAVRVVELVRVELNFYEVPRRTTVYGLLLARRRANMSVENPDRRRRFGMCGQRLRVVPA